VITTLVGTSLSRLILCASCIGIGVTKTARPEQGISGFKEKLHE